MLQKTIILFLLCINVFIGRLCAQGGFTVQNPTQVVYAGVWNPIILHCEKPTPFVISVVNGEQKLENNAHWIKPGKPGEVRLALDVKDNSYASHTYYFYFSCERLPYPVPYLKNKGAEKLVFNNRMKKSALLNSDSLIANIMVPDVMATATFKSFTVQFIDQKGNRTNISFTGSYLGKEFKDKLAELDTGDIIIFKEMDVSLTGENKPRRLQNIVVELE